MSRRLAYCFFILVLFSIPNYAQQSWKQHLSDRFHQVESSISLDSALHDLNDHCYSWIVKSMDTAKWCYELLLENSEPHDAVDYEMNALTALATLSRMGGKYEDAIRYYKKELTLFRKTNDIRNYWETINSIGLNYLEWGSLDSAQFYLKQAYLHYDKDIVSNNLGILYFKMGEYEFASRYYMEALNFAEKKRDTLSIGAALHNLGTLFLRLGNFNKSDQYVTRLEELVSQAGLANLYASNQLTRAEILLHNQQYDQAEQILITSIVQFRESGNWPDVSEGLQILAKVHLHQNSINQAMDDLQEAQQVNLRIDDPTHFVKNQLSISRIFQRLNQQQKALRSLLEINIDQIQPPELLSDLHLELGNLHAETGQWPLAAHHFQKYAAAKQQLDLAQQNRVIYEMQTEQDKLEMDQEIQALQLEQQEKEKRFSLQKKLSFALLTLLLVAIGLLVISRLNLKKSRLITAQQKLIHQQELQVNSTEKNIAIMEALVEGQESERKRVAHDLHDGLGTQLAGLKLQMQALQDLSQGGEDRKVDLQTIVNKTGEVYEEVRRIAHDMMPGVLAKFGLVEAVQHLCKQLQEGFDHTINFQVIGEEITLGEAREVMVYRIFQELLNNAVKHSGANEIIAQLSFFEHEISIGVEDNGKGFNLHSDSAASGFGLDGLRSRVNYLKGQLSIDTAPGRGTSVLVNFVL